MDRIRFRGANDSKIVNAKFWQEGSCLESITTYDFYMENILSIDNQRLTY